MLGGYPGGVPPVGLEESKIIAKQCPTPSGSEPSGFGETRRRRRPTPSGSEPSFCTWDEDEGWSSITHHLVPVPLSRLFFKIVKKGIFINKKPLKLYIKILKSIKSHKIIIIITNFNLFQILPISISSIMSCINIGGIISF